MNPEMEFRTRFKPDYTGMDLTELTFGTLQDHSGQLHPYKLDIITVPGKAESPRPVVFFIHGGGFLQPCDKRQAYICVFARTLTAAGYAVVSPDYPVFDDEAQLNAAGGEAAGYAKAGEAVHAAYQYLAENAAKLDLDMERVAIMGGSAGGMTAFYAIADYADRYAAFVNLWGAPDPLPSLQSFPPTLSVHGDADRLVPYGRELPVQQELERLGIAHELITLAGKDHTPLMCMDEFMPAIMALLERDL